MDRETHCFAVCIKRIGKLAIIAKRKMQRTARQGHLDLFSTEEDEGIELLHLSLSEIKASSFANLTM